MKRHFSIPVCYIVSLTIFSAPLMFFSIGSISIFKILAVLLILLLFRELIGGRYKSIEGLSSFWPLIAGFLGYNIAIQILFGLWGAVAYGDYPTLESAAPLNRLGVQLLSFMLIYAVTVYIYRYGRQKPTTITKPLTMCLTLMLVVSAYELLSIFFGFPKLPVTLEGQINEVNQNLSNMVGSYRIHSLAGEPRFYSVILGVVFNCLLLLFTHFYSQLAVAGKIRYLFLMAFILLLILLTQSSSGMLLIGILLPISFILSKNIRMLNKVRVFGLMVFIFSLMSPLIIDLVQTRVVERISEEMLSDKYIGTSDAAYIDVPGVGPVSFDATDVTPFALLLDKPFLIITGVGYGNISTYVKPYLPYYGGYWGYDYQGVVEPNMAFLKIFLNHGLIGTLMLMVLYWRFKKHYNTYAHQYSKMQLASFYTLTSVFICTYTVTSPMLVPIWFFAFHAALLDGCSSKFHSTGKTE